MKKRVVILSLAVLIFPIAASAYAWEELIGEFTWNPDGYEGGCGEITGEYTFGTIRCTDLEGDAFDEDVSIYVYPEDEGLDFTIEVGGLSDSHNNLPAGDWSEINLNLGTPPPPGDVVIRVSDLQTQVRIDKLRSGTAHEDWDDEFTSIEPTSLGQVKTTFN